jgi:hypothetical protein
MKTIAMMSYSAQTGTPMPKRARRVTGFDLENLQ